MDKASVKTMEMGARARQERQIMALLRKQNPYVVRLFFSFHTAHHLFFVMEYVPGSDCAAMLRAYGSLPEGAFCGACSDGVGERMSDSYSPEHVHARK